MNSIQDQDLALKLGDLVEVRSAAEIIATLDADGALEGLPFMPEMLAFCGQRFRVYRRAHKTCDTIGWTGLRGMDRTVHLDMLRCDGSAHGGCQAGCLLFWKESWLRRVADQPDREDGTCRTSITNFDPALESWLHERTRPAHDPERFRCQATELQRATFPLSPFNASQYFADVHANGATWHSVFRAFFMSAVNRLLRGLGCSSFPRTVGRLTQTPRTALDLEPGELVEVKSHDEVLTTLDRFGKNRGLSFDPEMVSYCGKRFQVLRRVEKIIDEKTGELRSLPDPCLILDGVVCLGRYHRLCPRSTYPYWREAWLRRVES